MRTLFIAILLFFIMGNLIAQKSLSIEINHEQPLGDLMWIYNPTIGITLSQSSQNDNGRISWNKSIGYFSFSPKQDTFYYLTSGESGFGTAVFTNYNSVILVGGISWKFPIGEQLSLNAGFNMGVFYTWYNIKTKDDLSSSESSTLQGLGALSPKLSINYKISEKIELSVKTKYNLIFPIGSTDPNSQGYNPGVGTFDTTLSNGVGLNYYF